MHTTHNVSMRSHFEWRQHTNVGACLVVFAPIGSCVRRHSDKITPALPHQSRPAGILTFCRFSFCFVPKCKVILCAHVINHYLMRSNKIISWQMESQDTMWQECLTSNVIEVVIENLWRIFLYLNSGALGGPNIHEKFLATTTNYFLLF